MAEPVSTAVPPEAGDELPTTERPAGRAGRDLRAAIGVGVSLVAVIVASLVLWRPAFLAVLTATVSSRFVKADRQDETDEIVGVLMPKVNRRHYLSASGAHEVARDMRAFGADVVVQRSAAITDWCDIEGGER